MYCMAETKIIVLDDDPTGIQTVFDIDVLMRFEVEDLLQIMKNPEELVYLSTNSRSLLPDETERLHRHIIQNLSKASKMTGREFLIISRGDSTMRGHYPLESEIIREELESLNYPLRGEIL
ncbi:MAG: hydroxyacid dehydrogenase, partial [Erysipelotrichaceae bacterium]|nr:hydroxyacid dehydrogenase [Erysipelotrichaceae bacterium]